MFQSLIDLNKLARKARCPMFKSCSDKKLYGACPECEYSKALMAGGFFFRHDCYTAVWRSGRRLLAGNYFEEGIKKLIPRFTT